MINKMIKKRQIILCILDGWGHREETQDNGIAEARTPTISQMERDFLHSLLQASGNHVGLPHGQMGNSEVGHMHLGAGRLIMQDLPRITQAIEDGSLARHPWWQGLAEKMRASGGAVHLLGLLSPGGVHSHQDHLVGLLKILQGVGVPVWLHGFLDGRDTPPSSALGFIKEVRSSFPQVRFGTIGGRYFGMDRDNRWDRVKLAYDAMVSPEGGEKSPTPEAAIEAAYKAGITDEFIPPTAMETYPGMKSGDGLLMGNFRADRARQILTAFLQEDFQGFPRQSSLSFSQVGGLTSYSDALDPFMTVLFPSQTLCHLLGEVVASAGLRQLRLAETEKYAHVTFFFNGGREQPVPGEKRILVPSPSVKTYDEQPEMSAFLLTDHLVQAIRHPEVELIVVNYANTDMVGHTGDLRSTVKAVEVVDECLKRVRQAVEDTGGTLLITADHGNAEVMKDPLTGQPHTAHTCNPVPFIMVNPPSFVEGVTSGSLADVAPTILDLWDLPQPEVMTGKSLLIRRERI
jgi:2,3-bisphosphoglycerate-independent phosphoglycerate mutase